MNVIEKFYTAFQQKDYITMQACYHPDARFTDEVFVDLDASQVRAMWHMLIMAGKDLQLEYRNVDVFRDEGSANWVATYTFSLTKRKVINDIKANFILKDNLIYRHHDHFDFHKWAKMAFGARGLFLGWTDFFRTKVRQTSREKLKGFMLKNNLGNIKVGNG